MKRHHTQSHTQSHTGGWMMHSLTDVRRGVGDKNRRTKNSVSGQQRKHVSSLSGTGSGPPPVSGLLRRLQPSGSDVREEKSQISINYLQVKHTHTCTHLRNHCCISFQRRRQRRLHRLRGEGGRRKKIPFLFSSISVYPHDSTESVFLLANVAALR